ncbi:unnamed protein product [Cylicostephanus goldi]|uniref:Core Histone H2A/H2B/H3 domain-containing protein n=1 Tax=Cylicostephanus goldi TaxID=71465 RepID=A0A3P7QD77_CYLGO|nr:unnamed protein product [Cylicostephanus goldi]
MNERMIAVEISVVKKDTDISSNNGDEILKRVLQWPDLQELQLPFQRVVRELTTELFSGDYRFTSESLEALQEVC